MLINWQIKIFEQFYLVVSATLLAIIIGIPLGIWLTRMPKIKNAAMSITAAIWTIPSLALLAFFIPFMGIGVKPAIITLAIYAILPILRNTITGLETIPASIKEAAQALGFTKQQQLLIIDLPLASPIIISGIRIATSLSMGIATLAAFIGAGGLGDFINQGLALNNSQLILAGAIPAALMALIFDFFLAQIEHNFNYENVRKKSRIGLYLSGIIIIGAIAIFSYFAIAQQYVNSRTETLRVATKNFTESIILGELITQMIEAKTSLHVIKKFNLGSTAICQTALINNEIDIYPEYTGTAYITVLHQTQPQSSAQVFHVVKTMYQKLFNLIWLPPFGFNNTQAIAVRDTFAKRYHLRTISDLLPIDNQLIIGTPADFIKRPDGFIGLQKVYGLHFKEIKQMDPSLMYQAIKNKDVNVINAFSTDGRIPAYSLQVLEDNKHFYPPYDAAIVIRDKVLKKQPEIMRALQPLFGLINDKTMQQLNYEVDVLKKSPRDVAQRFLIKKGLLPKSILTNTLLFLS